MWSKYLKIDNWMRKYLCGIAALSLEGFAVINLTDSLAKFQQQQHSPSKTFPSSPAPSYGVGNLQFFCKY